MRKRNLQKAATQSRRIGLALDAVAAYGRGIVRGVMSYTHTKPRWTINVEPQWSFSKPVGIERWDVDGLIVQTFSREFEKRVINLGLPATNVSNFCPGELHLPSVLPDDDAVAVMAADYLISLGFRQLAYCWSGTTQFGRLRLQAFRRRAAESGIPVHECNTMSTQLDKWVRDLPKPIGVLGCNDDFAHRVLNAVRQQGIKVPDQLAVLGVDNDELFNTLVTPSLSSIALPAEQIGFEAAAQLDRLMNGEKLKPLVTLLPPVRVIPRASTDVLSIEDEDIVAAVRFIREHAAEPLQVDDVLDHVPLSRRSLERRFRQLVRHSISDEIRRAHIDRAKDLLANSDLAMSQVAAASGFTTASRLGIVFHREVGEPPSEFRRRARVSRRLDA
jgi:LacI family transcriptional regulator, galactose operon repressor